MSLHGRRRGSLREGVSHGGDGGCNEIVRCCLLMWGGFKTLKIQSFVERHVFMIGVLYRGVIGGKSVQTQWPGRFMFP